jgi:predicted ArsR family transcriptional regulator
MLRSPVIEIILHLKRSPGMSVKELCEVMKMSYMGVKQHCDELVKKGFLDTWRRPKPTGRPEKVYRLTHKLDPLFPTSCGDMTEEMLDISERVFGETAPQKLLFTYFQEKSEALIPRMQGRSTAERALMLAKVRSDDGCMSVCEVDEAGQEIRLVEYHCPFASLAKRYEIIRELECDMLERLLECPVQRTMDEISGLTRIVFKIRLQAGTKE